MTTFALESIMTYNDHKPLTWSILRVYVTDAMLLHIILSVIRKNNKKVGPVSESVTYDVLFTAGSTVTASIIS